MKSLSLRWRLTAYSGLVLLVFALVSGAAFYGSLQRDLRQTMDAHLQDVAEQAGQQWQQTGSLQGLPERDTYNVVLSVIGADGRVLAATGPVTATTIGPVTPPPESAPGFQSWNGQRVYTAPVRRGQSVRVATSEYELFEALSHTQKLLFLALPLLVLLGLGGGYLLIDRALKPIDAVSRVAQQIATSGQYTQRVPASAGHDEAAVTARTVNAMLARLEELIEHERAFSLAAAHELRTPLSVLLARSQLGLESLDLEEALSALKKTETSALELAALVDGLLTLARSQGSLQCIQTNLADVALSALEGFQENAVRPQLDLQSAPLIGDPTALQLAVRNLLENAQRYGRGGRWVTTGLSSGQPWLAVGDDGPGIPLPERARLLRPFQRLSASQAGAGLGLALVQAVTRQHGGEVRFEHPPDGRFTVRLVFPETGSVDNLP